MTEAFEPRNDLERQLMDIHDGRISQDDFVQHLLTEQVFMPVLEDSTGVQGLQKSSKAHPLTVQEEGGAEVLILFTSPERAKPFVQHFPGFETGGLLTEFTWILERIGQGGLGIAINPGWDIGIDFEAPMVATLAQSISKSSADGQASKE